MKPLTPCSSCDTAGIQEQSVQRDTKETVDRFNIVAAMNQNRVIGVDGRLPWTIPNDRLHFEALTRQKVLIIGRHTFFEAEDFSHLNHLRHVIVVSTTLDETTVKNFADTHPAKAHLAHSFEESLLLAKSLERDLDGVERNCHEHGGANDIDCWIGGGQRLYEHAIRHEAANEIYLTLVDENSIQTGDATTSFFPAKYRWDNVFFEVHEKTKVVNDDHGVGFRYTFLTYMRRRKANERFTT